MITSAPPSARPIRSFVRREGRITRAQRQALAELWPIYGVEPGVLSLDLSTVFKRQVPVIMEIGFGNGDTLTALAANDPECDFLGVDVYRPGVGSLLIKLRRFGLTNVRVFCEDAIDVLTHRIAPDSLTKILIFFPDPWPKKRHHKRRLIEPKFVRLATGRLVIGGALHVATDWQDYAEQMLEVLNGERGLRNTADTALFSLRPSYRPETKYERRGQGLGYNTWDLIFERIR